MEGQWLCLEIHTSIMIFSLQFSREGMQMKAGGEAEPMGLVLSKHMLDY